MSVSLNTGYLSRFVREHEYESISKRISLVHDMLHSYTGQGSEFTGWLELPTKFDRDEIIRIKEIAEKIKSDTDVFIVVGIGGSYLGAKAVIDFIKSPNYNFLKKDTPEIFFVGNNISSDYLNEILSICKGKRVSLNVISKSGTTTESAIAFKIFREYMEKEYGDKARERIYCTTDSKKGTLRDIANAKGYQTFAIPDSIGGRFSVLTPVGLLPIAVCGVDIDLLINGAAEAEREFLNPDIANNNCYKYAAIRNILYKKGKLIEIFSSYEPRLSGMLEWCKQLFGESEGKDHKGIFPASAMFSTDLHSIGQFIQDGSRTLFETVIFIDNPIRDIAIEFDSEDLDSLNFISGKTVSHVNKKAFEGTVLAHSDGGTPCIVINVDSVSEYNLGYLIYFFEKACAMSSYILGVNPFDQPGVESYKKNMFALLGKPGYEKYKNMLESKLI